MKRFCVLTIVIASVFLSSTIHPERPTRTSLTGVSQSLMKEIGDVEYKLDDTRAKIKEVKEELEDVKRIATGSMIAPKPTPEKESVLEVTKQHIKAIDPAKEEAIGLHATPTGTSLPRLADKLIKTQKAYQKANENLQKTITDEKLLEKLRSVEPAPILPMVPDPIPPAAPMVIPSAAPEPMEEALEPAPAPEPTVSEEEETLMDILGGKEEKPANEKKKMSNRKKRRLKNRYLL